MTDKQKELVCSIKLKILKAIVDISDERLWELIQKAVESEVKADADSD